MNHRPLSAEPLENRLMLHGDSPLPVITLHTNVGEISIELFAEEAPATVANFRNYVNDGDLINSIIHRSVSNFVIQGGGFRASSAELCEAPCGVSDVDAAIFDEVPVDPPVVNEFGISNLRGTVSMAKVGGDPNSATSQFFVNLNDNSQNLDNQNGGFTVFGRVVDMTASDEIASFGKSNLSSLFPPSSRLRALSDVPVRENDNGFVELVRVESISGLGVIHGTVFHDFNGNGSQESSEGGLAMTVVYDDANNNGTRDAGELSTTVSSNGHYHLRVEPGSYRLRVESLADFRLTSTAAQDVTVEIGNNYSDRDFGFVYEGTSWHNPILDFDVDGQNGVSPVDALLVINELNDRAISDAESGALPPLTSTPSTIRFLDVVQDDIVAPLDALLVINNLGGGTPQAASSTAISPLPQMEPEDDADFSVFDSIFASFAGS